MKRFISFGFVNVIFYVWHNHIYIYLFNYIWCFVMLCYVWMKILLKDGPYGHYVQLGEDKKGHLPKRASVSQVYYIFIFLFLFICFFLVIFMTYNFSCNVMIRFQMLPLLLWKMLFSCCVTPLLWYVFVIWIHIFFISKIYIVIPEFIILNSYIF